MFFPAVVVVILASPTVVPWRPDGPVKVYAIRPSVPFSRGIYEMIGEETAKTFGVVAMLGMIDEALFWPFKAVVGLFLRRLGAAVACPSDP